MAAARIFYREMPLDLNAFMELKLVFRDPWRRLAGTAIQQLHSCDWNIKHTVREVSFDVLLEIMAMCRSGERKRE